jgi:hypothetical protein
MFMVEILKLIGAMGIIIVKRLLMVVTYHFLPKDKANEIC